MKSNPATVFVLLPGLDGTGRLFDPFLKVLPVGTRTKVVSYPRDQKLNLDALEAHVRRLLPSKNPFVLVGESFGGLLATRIASQAPEGLRALVLCASFVTSPISRVFLPLQPLMGPYLFKKRPPQAVTRYLLAGAPYSPSMRRFLEDALLSTKPEVLWSRLKLLAKADESTALKKCPVPVLYLTATNDRLVSKKALDHIRAVRPDVRVVPIEAPHFLLQLAPKKAWEAMKAFLDESPCTGEPLRILIATATAGGGHLQAAAALEEAWTKLRPGDTVHRLDILEFTPTLYRKAYAEGYVKLAEKVPELYAHAFRISDNSAFVRRITPFRRLSARFITGKFVQTMNDFRPHVILCPHFLAIETMGSLEGKDLKYPRPLTVCVVTDFEAHALWMEPCVDLYCVAMDETKARLVARGVSSAKIVVTGIPVSGRFLTPVPAGPLKRRFRLNLNQPTLLVLGGGMGMGPLVETLRELDKAQSEIQMLVVAGRNEKLLKQLQSERFHHRVKVFGFVTNMQELMAVSDLIVTKPGGLTSSEALALGKPVLIVNPLPGQEAANSDFLLEHGAAMKVNRIEDLPFRVDQLAKGKQLERMARAAKPLGKPGAARDICEVVLRRLGV